MRSAEKHIFNQSVDCLKYASLGDTCVRIIALKNLTGQYGLDYKILRQNNSEFYRIWKLAFGNRLIDSLNDIKGTEFEYAIMHAPTHLDWQFGSAGYNVFESIYWENGFFQTANLKIEVMNLIHSDSDSRNIMIYPNEKTDGNVIFDSQFWLDLCRRIKEKQYRINLIGDVRHEPLKEFYEKCPADFIYEPTIDNLINCIGNSCMAIGGSTGPTWACLLSDIRQIVLESKRSPHGYWFFERCKQVLEKDIKIIPTLESLLT